MTVAKRLAHRRALVNKTSSFSGDDNFFIIRLNTNILSAPVKDILIMPYGNDLPVLKKAYDPLCLQMIGITGIKQLFFNIYMI
jgi:hypothetical protein